ncbi:MAG: hypothetical protein OXP66_17725 [Candidatus Tectomicrobia bacterium]|nr:hypothetical protein [Candidatus Tectomicrobia bacterium]
MKTRMMVPAVALAAAMLPSALLPAPAKASDEGRFTMMLLVIHFFKNARPQWGPVKYGWRIPLEFPSFIDCQAAADRFNQRHTKVHYRQWTQEPFKNQIICHAEKATDDQTMAWDICDRIHIGIRYARTCQALTYHKPHVADLPDKWLRWVKRGIRQ